MTEDQLNSAQVIKQQIYMLEEEISGLKAIDRLHLGQSYTIITNKSFVQNTEDDTFKFYEQKAASDFIEKLIVIREQRISNLKKEFKEI